MSHFQHFLSRKSAIYRAFAGSRNSAARGVCRLAASLAALAIPTATAALLPFQAALLPSQAACQERTGSLTTLTPPAGATAHDRLEPNDDAARWRNVKEGLSLRIPAELLEVPVHYPQALLALKHRSRPYPTFNIVVQSGFLDISGQTLARRAEELVASYRQLGLHDATLQASELLTLNGRSALSAAIAYSNDAQQLRSQVTALSLSDRHYFFTFVGLAGDWPRDKNLSAQLLESIELTGAMPDGHRDVDNQPIDHGGTIRLLLIGIIFAAVAILFVRALRSR